ncbi:MAG: Rrf2 family transcriptional regulator [Hyphomicrobiaceae bacterium]|nr:Rrf2 family transcriptional regulator [Hyphomicrobiaceae bacterium]
MRLSKQTSDAIQLLCYCYRNDKRLCKLAEIAYDLGLTKQVAFKLSKVLNHAGLIETIRGPHGGVKILSSTKSVSIGSIVRKLENKPLTNRCKQDNGLLHTCIDEAFEAFLEVLDHHTLAEMATRRGSTSNVNRIQLEANKLHTVTDFKEVDTKITSA